MQEPIRATCKEFTDSRLGNSLLASIWLALIVLLWWRESHVEGKMRLAKLLQLPFEVDQPPESPAIGVNSHFSETVHATCIIKVIEDHVF
jgi:hypothetical protein